MSWHMCDKYSRFTLLSILWLIGVFRLITPKASPNQIRPSFLECGLSLSSSDPNCLATLYACKIVREFAQAKSHFEYELLDTHRSMAWVQIFVDHPKSA